MEPSGPNPDRPLPPLKVKSRDAIYRVRLPIPPESALENQTPPISTTSRVVSGLSNLFRLEMRRQIVPRRKRAVRRPDVPDAKYKSRNVARFTNKLMLDGKRSLAERIIYDAFDVIEAKQKRPPLDVFEQALKNATSTVEVKPRRLGGSTYQVPIDVRRDRGNALAMRWLIKSARSRTGHSMSEKLASELMDAAAGQGMTIKKREETHKMAKSNKAFAHYRW